MLKEDFKCWILGLLVLCALAPAFVCAQQTTKGKDFYVSFLPNFHTPSSPDSLYLYVVAEQPTTGTISYNDGLSIVNKAFTLTTAGQIYQIGVWWYDFEMTGYNTGFSFVNFNDNEYVTHRSFHIQASQDVAVYALNQADKTSDAALIFPVPALGTEYYIMSYKADGVVSSGSLALNYTPSEFSIVATQDSTKVIVYPTAPTTQSGMSAKSVVLNKGDTWLCQSEFNTSNLNYDLSGTRVVATAPVAVFSGHQRATIPVEDNKIAISRDHLYEQLPPTSVWGMSYIITPLPNPSGSTPIVGAYDMYRVVASEDGTVLHFNGAPVGTLQRSQVFEAPLTVAGLLTASKKVLVGIFAQTHSNNSSSIQNGDPFMLIVPPRAQYLTQYHFINCQVDGTYNDQYITVITANTNTGNVRLDGSVLTATWKAIPNTCYVYANVRMNDGAHTLQSPLRVGLFIYGYGPAVSYGYVGGMAFVPDLGDDAVTAGPDRSLCIGDSVQLTSTGKAQNLRWSKLNSSARFYCDTCPSIWVNPSQTTNYLLSANDSLGCFILDTVQVVVSQIPDVSISPDSALCTDMPIVLHARGQFETATWSPPIGLSCTTCNNPTATPGKNTRYYVTVHNGSSTHCTAIDSIDVRYRYGISNAFPKGDTICRGDSVLLQLKYGGNLRWAPSVGLSCTNCQKAWAKPTQSTTYTVYADSADCTSQAQVTITVVDPPTLTMPHSISVCAGKSTTVNLGTNATSILWTPARNLSSTTSSQVVIRADSTDLSYTVRASGGGNSCAAVDTIHVHVLPSPTVRLDVSDTTICSNAAIQIHAQVTNTDNVTWQPSTGLSCTSCLDPIVSASGDQSYTITVSHADGCDTSAQVNIHVRTAPTLQIQTHTFRACVKQPIQLHGVSNQTIHWSPTLGLGCVDCNDPIATFDSAGVYSCVATVSVSNGCIVRDTVVVTIDAIPTDSLSVDRDTLCLTNGISQISLLHGLVGSTYTWDADPGLSCYNCPNPTARPSQSTVYHCHITSANGCQLQKDVAITVVPCSRKLLSLDNNAGSFSACGSRTVLIPVSNEGELPLIIDSVYEQSGSGVHMMLDSSVHLPLTLNGAQRDSIKLHLLPTQYGALSLTVVLRSNATNNGGDTLTLVHVQAQGSQYQLGVVLRADTISPGSLFNLPIELQSDAWADMGVTALDFRLRYKSVWMQYQSTATVEKNFYDQSWRVTDDGEQRVGDESMVTFHLRGDSALKNSGIILLPRFRSYLSADKTFHATADSIWLPLQQRCVTTTTSSDELVPFGCAHYLRPVEFGTHSFELKGIDPNPAQQAAIHCRYALGFDCHPTMRIIDALGRTVQTVVDEQQIAGDYQVDVDVSAFSAGLYTCEFRADGLVFVKSFVLHK